MKADELHDLSEICRALGDPLRLKILRLLSGRPVCRELYNVNELADELGSSQPNISRHLHILKRAGLVECRKTCASVYYWRRTAAFTKIRRLLASFESARRTGCSK
ncbi:MAG: winged helix-turn-helix transcriptional regulator [Planctomycetes bacterium]|nr:winged helix-turn-helix transcriptional regulator [Planctomycetota bacterium]